MKAKIVHVNLPHCDAVLLAVARSEDKDGDYVEITAWHRAPDDVDLYQYEIVNCPTHEMCEQFINDYSNESAILFAEAFNF